MEQMFFCLVLRVIGFCLCKPLILNVIETFARRSGLDIPSAAAGVLANQRPLLRNGRLIVSRQPYDRLRSTGRSGLDIPFAAAGVLANQRPLLRKAA